MATVPPITVPIVTEPLGELMVANLGLKCCPCTDNAITNDTPVEDVPVAITLAPSLQQFTMGTETIHAPVVLPVCIDCRRRQLGIQSKTGLVVA